MGSIPLISNSSTTLDTNGTEEQKIQVKEFGNQTIDKPITVITIGAGSRGNTYGDYGLQFPNELNIVGVAEPNPIRNERYAKKHAIAAQKRFTTWEDVFKQPKFADAVIISTPDDLHYKPCMKALEMDMIFY